MRPDEIFIVLLLIASIGVVAALAIHSRRNAAASQTTDASPSDARPEMPIVEERPDVPRRERAKQRR